MAQDTDDGDKTEEPTQWRLDDAAKHGDVVKSQEVVAFIVLGVGTLAVALFARQGADSFITGFRGLLEQPDQIAVDSTSVMVLARHVVWTLFLMLGPALGLMMIAGLAAHMLQARPSFNLEKLAPNFSKISLTSGFKRLFGRDGLINLVKGVIKMAIVAGAIWSVLWPERGRIAEVLGDSPTNLGGVMMALAFKIAMATLVVLALVAVLDYLLQRFQFMQRNRMSRQELKEEMRQSDGDPHIKAKLRQIRMERARKRMMARVPQATVVVMNPTHFAVALQYEQGKTLAPICVAKGVDAVALRIRDKAKEHGVPVVENPPLARALYAAVEIDDAVPPEHYKAVAQVIGYVLKLSGKLRPN